MRKLHTLLLFGCLVATSAHGQNSCATAQTITTGTYTVAVVDGDAPTQICTGGQIAQHGEWYRFYSDTVQALTVSTDLPANTGGDTRVQIYTGTCGALTCVGGDDDSGSGYLSYALVNATANTWYYIVFDDRWSAAGFQFEVSTATGPAPGTGPVFTQQSLPVNPLAVVDMNGDGLDDLVAPAGTSVTLGFQQQAGGFTVNTLPTPPAMHSPSWSMCVGDIDGNGKNDLMYGGGSGVAFMMMNDEGTAFTQQGFAQYIFSQRTNMVDINNDGRLDAFVCHDVDANVRFMNQGNGVLQLIQGGTGSTCGNYGSLWTDVNNDGLMDLFVAKCGCDPVDILMINEGNQVFTSIAAANGFADNHQSWSSAWGDFDNDGDMDVLVGSSSSNVHKLMRNNGDGTFTNVTAGSGFHNFSGSSIEWTTHDFDNDGNLDIMGGGKLMMGNGDMTFNPATGAFTNGPVGDLNNDGFLDYTNGGTGMINAGNANHWLRVVPRGVISNTNGIGARIEVVTASGTRIREIRSGDGFRYMSSLYAHFGLGADTHIDEVVIRWPSGIVQHLFDLDVDQTIFVTESSTVGVEDVAAEAPFTLHPNPVRDHLRWSGPDALLNQPFEVIDAAGRMVMLGTLSTGSIDVSGLKVGTYTLQVVGTDDKAMQQRFVKQ
jgi:hypothetical protein